MGHHLNPTHLDNYAQQSIIQYLDEEEDDIFLYHLLRFLQNSPKYLVYHLFI